VEVAVGKEDEAAVLGLGVFAGLLLADEWVFVLGLGFEDDEWEALFIEQQEIDEAFAGLLEVFAEGIEVVRFERDAGLKLDVCRAACIGKEAPSRRLEQLVDFDALVNLLQ
jgi:hypothetical protein